VGVADAGVFHMAQVHVTEHVEGQGGRPDAGVHLFHRDAQGGPGVRLALRVWSR
jgi:hypothetical protein